MKQLLLNERWRPRTIEDMILLPRISKIFENGLKQNVILYGHFGTGKTTLARILVGKWSKNKPFIEINSSFYTSIDTLRTKVDDFCSQVYMGLDLMMDTKMDNTKYVFLDEFERTSLQYPDALPAYIEEYSTKGVRFILNTNHIDKISEGIKSRMLLVNFDAQSTEEEKFLKRSIFTKIMTKICPEESILMSREILVKLINETYPDFRCLMNRVQYYAETGHYNNSNNIDETVKNELYQIVCQPNCDFETSFKFISDKFGAEGITEMIKLLGTQFTTWCLKERKDLKNKLFEINNHVAVSTEQLHSSIDPIVVGLSLIGNINKLISS